MSSATYPSAADDGVAQFLSILSRPGDVLEIRVPKYDGRNTASGYFNDPVTAADAVRRWDGKANIYVTLNPVKPALLARAANEFNQSASATTSDTDIVERRWILVDIDPKRPAGISATDTENMAAGDVARGAREYLTGKGWTMPLMAMTGNGFALLFPISLPNVADSTALYPVSWPTSPTASIRTRSRSTRPCRTRPVSPVSSARRR